MQGRKRMKRFVLALAICGSSLLMFGAGNAFAACELGIGSNNARAGDEVVYTVSNCTAGDRWEIKLVLNKNTPDEVVKRVGTSGEAQSGDPVTGTFVVPDLGGESVDAIVRLDFKDASGAEQPPVDLEGAEGLTYLGQALPTGPTGPTTGGTTGPLESSALVPVPTFTRQEAQQKAKKEAVKKKKSSSGKNNSNKKNSTKKKSDSKKDSGPSNPTSTPSTPVPITPSYTPPTTSTPPPVTSTPQTDFTPPTTTTPPPGIQGPPAGDQPAPTPPVPDVPSAAAPIAPIAPVATSGDGNNMPVPVWLMILLGLVALLGLGGAQARLLGFWGPPLPMNGRDTSDARLLALQRVSQSGASFQKRIAELKKAAREREPVG